MIKVYRFEVERGGQIAGNLFSAALGVLNCGFGGSSRACAGALARQGQAMPDGWFRLRKLQLNCYNGVFDILGDGIKRQRIAADRKGQAQRSPNACVQLANNDCCERSMICCRRRQMGSTIPSWCVDCARCQRRIALTLGSATAVAQGDRPAVELVFHPQHADRLAVVIEIDDQR